MKRTCRLISENRCINHSKDKQKGEMDLKTHPPPLFPVLHPPTSFFVFLLSTPLLSRHFEGWICRGSINIIKSRHPVLPPCVGNPRGGGKALPRVNFEIPVEYIRMRPVMCLLGLYCYQALTLYNNGSSPLFSLVNNRFTLSTSALVFAVAYWRNGLFFFFTFIDVVNSREDRFDCFVLRERTKDEDKKNRRLVWD